MMAKAAGNRYCLKPRQAHLSSPLQRPYRGASSACRPTAPACHRLSSADIRTKSKMPSWQRGGRQPLLDLYLTHLPYAGPPTMEGSLQAFYTQ